MYNVTAYIPPPATRPTDPALAYPIFRNTDREQLRAGAELKSTQAGLQGAHSPRQFGGEGEFKHVQELAAALGGPNTRANDTLGAAVAAFHALLDGLTFDADGGGTGAINLSHSTRTGGARAQSTSPRWKGSRPRTGRSRRAGRLTITRGRPRRYAGR